MMTFNKFYPVLLFMFVLIGCNSEEGKPDTITAHDQVLPEIVKKGKVVYDVSYPFVKDAKIVKWFPKEFVLSFKENEIYGEMNSRSDLICNRIFSDLSKKEVHQTLDNVGNKFRCITNEQEMAEIISGMPMMMIQEPIGDTVIAGIKCRIRMAEFVIDSVPAVKLYTTDRINIENPNWFNQYKDLNEFLMGYDIEQFGMRMRLIARTVSPKPDPISKELIFKGAERSSYKELTPKELQLEYKKLLETFL